MSDLSINEPRPSVGRPLAEAISSLYVERREVEHDMRWRHADQARRQVNEARYESVNERIEALLQGVTAHTLTWAHMPVGCPICDGEVTL